MHKPSVIVVAGLLLFASGAMAAEDTKPVAEPPSCDEIQAAWDEGGGAVSEDMLAKQMNVSVERIRSCLKKEAMELEKTETPPSK